MTVGSLSQIQALRQDSVFQRELTQGAKVLVVNELTFHIGDPRQLEPIKGARRHLHQIFACLPGAVGEVNQ
jgi:hypothetical protein